MRSMYPMMALITVCAACAVGGLGRVGFGQEIRGTEPERKDPAPASHSGLWRSKAQPYHPAPDAQKGHYKTLLRHFEAPADQQQYGDFFDSGYWAGTTYGDQKDLPPGYWVYLAPQWYIFKDAAGGVTPPSGPRAWGPEQATGAPDTWPKSGDLTTAWAAAKSSGQHEWLELSYEGALRPVAVSIYETYHPGAVERVTAYDAAGKEVELWSGTDPTEAGEEKGISVIPLHPKFDVSRIRIYVNSARVPGWNEIDAVGLLDAAGATHWATHATASSTYADYGSNTTPFEVYILDANENR